MTKFSIGSFGLAPKKWNDRGNKFFFGEKDKAKRFKNLTPEQQQTLSDVMTSLTGEEGPYSDVYGKFDPEQAGDVFQQSVADPAYRNFEQKTIPGIMQSFADQGPSSGLYQTLATSGRDLNENLAGQRSKYIYDAQQANLARRQQGIQTSLNTQVHQPYIQAGYKGLVPGVVEGFAKGAGQAAGTAALA